MADAETSKDLTGTPAAVWGRLTAGDLMTEDMVTVSLSATARDIERTLVENGISGAPVRDTSGAICGIVSWRDVMEYFAQSAENEPHRPHAFFRYTDAETLEGGEEIEVPIDDAATAADMMSTDLLTTERTATLKELSRAMISHRVHRLLVRDGDGVVGIVSSFDILEALAAG